MLRHLLISSLAIAAFSLSGCIDPETVAEDEAINLEFREVKDKAIRAAGSACETFHARGKPLQGLVQHGFEGDSTTMKWAGRSRHRNAIDHRVSVQLEGNTCDIHILPANLRTGQQYFQLIMSDLLSKGYQPTVSRGLKYREFLTKGPIKLEIDGEIQGQGSFYYSATIAITRVK